MADVTFKDNRVSVEAAIDAAILAFLHEVGGELAGKTADAASVDSGQLKGSWTFRVNEPSSEVIVGNPLENAIWEEFGTGIYAEAGNGRKEVPWSYKDVKGNWHKTSGKRPKRTFRNTFDKVKPLIEQTIKEKFGRLG